jgi:uncharacterized glyoxalase superfamily protein PhnB
MADPFEALRQPEAAVDPDATFAARLRARVERALALPEGVTVSDLTIDSAPGSAPGPGGSGALVPYLIVADARRALDWYASAWGARPLGDVITMADGRIGHAELALEGAVFYLADESPESQVAAPRPGADATVSLSLEVPDVDRVVDRARAAGAVVERPVADYPYGRNGVVRDPFGHRWIFSTPTEAGGADVDVIPGADRLRQGDLGYVSLWVPDAERAARFFSTVLGWSYDDHLPEQTHQVVGRDLHHGVNGGHERSTLYLCFVVDDIAAAVERVRHAGGRSEEPTHEAHGLTAMCVDPEGTQFSLYEPPAGPRGRRLAANGTRHGDLSYVTMEVGDSAVVRAFYGTVLGWDFRPGRVEDGWGPADVVPMTGLSGGHQTSTVVPMYRVDDIHVAVARVRGAGGSAAVPERQPYGVTSECVDDQGTRFYLGQL